MPTDYHIFRDPVHGYIRVNDLEQSIISTAPFQRLRRIRQLAFTHYIYHGAEHTRFGHSIGTMEIATQIFDVLDQKHLLGNDRAEIGRSRQLLRLAALTHDLGHAPFSHAAENLFPLVAGTAIEHEDMSAAIIQQTEIGELIREHTAGNLEITPSEVAELITGGPRPRNAFLREILSGDLDADRIDYLTRDSMMAGVRYGVFDFERLIHTLTLYEDERSNARLLALEDGGVHAVEGLILARYFMFTQVYFHPVRRAYDYLLAQFLRSTLSDGSYPDNPDDFIQWDDNRVIEEIRDAALNRVDERHEPASRIWNRHHYQLVTQTAESATQEELHRWVDQILPAVEAEFGSEIVISDDAEKAPHKFDTSRLRVQNRHDGKLRPVRTVSALGRVIPDIRQRRMYVTKDGEVQTIRHFVAEICDRHPV